MKTSFSTLEPALRKRSFDEMLLEPREQALFLSGYGGASMSPDYLLPTKLSP